MTTPLSAARIDDSPQPLAVVDREGRIIAISSTLAQVLHAAPGDCIGRPWVPELRRLVRIEDQPAIDTAWANVQTFAKRIEVHGLVPEEDGTLWDLSLEPAGEPATDFRIELMPRARTAAIESSRLGLLRLLAERSSSPMAAIAVPSFTIVLFNEAAKQLAGRDALGRLLKQVVERPQCQEIESLVRQIEKSETPQTLHTVLLPSREPTTWEIDALPFFGDGHVNAVLFVAGPPRDSRDFDPRQWRHLLKPPSRD